MNEDEAMSWSHRLMDAGIAAFLIGNLNELDNDVPTIERTCYVMVIDEDGTAYELRKAPIKE